LSWRPDAVSVLSLTVLFAFVVPARFVVHGFGAVGTPANVLGIGLFALWGLGTMTATRRTAGCRPVRVIIAIYLLVLLITYAGGFARGMFSDEENNATRLVIQTFALCGMALVACDAIKSRERLLVLLQRIVFGAAFMALAGDLEATIHYSIAPYLHFPGLVLNDHLILTGARGTGGFPRVAGTASHYIEFGVVLGMLLPLAIHFAVFSPTRGRRHFNWLLAGIMAVGVPFAVSRAAAIALILSMLIIAACWTWRARFNALVLAIVLAIGMKALRPGLLGTIRSLFTNASTDPSISGRTTDYTSSFFYIRQRPWFGRGAGTYLPERYRILDNQMLLTTIESGVVGLVALVLLFMGGTALAHRVAKFSPDPETRHLAYALLPIFVVGFVTSFTFDSLSFPIFSIVLFVGLGAVGALWRLDQPARERARGADSALMGDLATGGELVSASEGSAGR
jgi:O-antigen ligase